MTWPPPKHTVHVLTYAAPLPKATPYGANRPPSTVWWLVPPGVIFTSAPIGPVSRPLLEISTAYSDPSGANARSVRLVSPEAQTVAGRPGTTRQMLASPFSNGKPVSWLM